MAEKLDPKEVTSFEELMMSNIFFQEAIMNQDPRLDLGINLQVA